MFGTSACPAHTWGEFNSFTERAEVSQYTVVIILQHMQAGQLRRKHASDLIETDSGYLIA